MLKFFINRVATAF